MVSFILPIRRNILSLNGFKNTAIGPHSEIVCILSLCSHIHETYSIQRNQQPFGSIHSSFHLEWGLKVTHFKQG